MQQPHLVGFMEMTPDLETVALDSWGGWEQEQVSHYFFYYKLHRRAIVFSDEWPFAHDAQLEVLTDIVMIGDNVAASSAPSWKPLAEIEVLLPPLGCQADSDNDEDPIRHDPSPCEDRWHDCPWVLDFLATGDKPNPAGMPKPWGHVHAGAHVVDSELVMDAVQAAREEWMLRDVHVSTNFRWRLLGGDWTAEFRGVSYDAFEATARGKDAKAFCYRWTLSAEANYHVSVYGEEGGFTLATAWCHKMQCLFDKAIADGGIEEADFQPDWLNSYIEPPGAAELYETATARMTIRINALRAMTPVRRL